MENAELKAFKLTLVIPCFNEEKTLAECVDRVLGISDEDLELEILIVDDGSTDGSLKVAQMLVERHKEVIVLHHEINQGKGAALRNGFQMATGDFVAVQDADLEYDPMDLKRLLTPLKTREADVVMGSRFLSSGAHRVLYFWHYLGNRFLTFISNMFTDLNLTDMESCYKVFRRDVIQNMEIRENRFGVEPEIVARVAHMRLRVFEMGISYHGRTYEEGKKIGAKDGIRAIYCILRYNAHRAPLPVQFLLYSVIGGLSAVVNYIAFLTMFSNEWSVAAAAPVAFIIAAVFNYLLCIFFLFRHKAKWNSVTELFIFLAVVVLIGFVDLKMTEMFMQFGWSAGNSKLMATALGLLLNFTGRRFLVFPESPSGPWKPQKDFDYQD